ncbi:MAG: phosphate transport system permease protein, partial [Candidatus Paceibacteria bacterium]
MESSTLQGSARRRLYESLIRNVLRACAGLSVLTSVGIFFVLLKESLPFFEEVHLTEFLFGTTWAPLME